MSANGFINEKPLTRRELLAAMIIFLLPLLMPLISLLTTTGIMLPQWMVYFLLMLIWGVPLFALGLALIKGLPRWSPGPTCW